MKEQYIKQVEKELSLTRKAKKEVVRDLNEVFASALEHGETEQQVIERLGTPKEFAENTAEQLGIDSAAPQKRKGIISSVAALVVAVAAFVIYATTMLDAGVWPVNEYTEGLPVPSGTVGWAMLDTEHENCSISIVDISETDYNDYLELLKQEGFSIIEEVSEEIEGQDYVSIGTLLSNGEKGLSISYIPDNFTIYISFLK